MVSGVMATVLVFRPLAFLMKTSLASRFTSSSRITQTELMRQPLSASMEKKGSHIPPR